MMTINAQQLNTIFSKLNETLEESICLLNSTGRPVQAEIAAELSAFLDCNSKSGNDIKVFIKRLEQPLLTAKNMLARQDDLEYQMSAETLVSTFGELIDYCEAHQSMI